MKEKKNYWMIDDCSTKFDTLWDAKNHTTFWTRKELEKYNGSAVMHYKGQDVVSICTMTVKDGRPHFTRTLRVLPNHVF